MKKLKVAVIGAGYLGRFHAQKYLQLPHCELIGIADTDLERGPMIANELEVPYYPHHQELLGLVDAVSVVVPTIHHHSVTLDFLKKGVHVLVEKPFTTTLEEAQDLLKISEEQQLCLQVGHIERFNPVFTAFQSSIQCPQFIEAQRIAPFPKRGTDVDVILDLMIHDIDLVLALVGEPPKQIDAVGISVITQSTDLANVRLQFPGGCVANLTASRVSAKAERKMRIFQPGLYLSLDFGALQARRLKCVDLSVVTPQTLTPEIIDIPKTDALLAEIQSFLNAIETNTPPIVSGQAGLQAIQVAWMIKEQMPQQSVLI